MAQMTNLSWFKNTDCIELNILKYKSLSEESVVASTVIKNKEGIKYFIDRINSLPADGDEKISFGPKSERALLIFTCADNTFVNIEIISNKIKTPSTGFISKKNSIEENICRDIDGLVSPDLNKRILKIPDHPVKFQDFTIAFIKSEHTPQPEGGPTIGPTSKAYYHLWEKGTANLLNIIIFTGQIPPAPQHFVTQDKKIYYLLTYRNVAGEPLGANYFEISDRKI
jgi:hypothetical protein